jgi:hypothetical protein
MKRKLIGVLIVAVLMFSSGCATVDVKPVDASKTPKNEQPPLVKVQLLTF